MYRRDSDTRRYPDRYDWDSEEAGWDQDRDDAQRPRRGFFGRVVSLLKLAVLLLPVAMFLCDSFADCSAWPAGWLGIVGASACARSEMLGNVLSMQDNFALLKRLID
jgi:hypothetical protein